MSLDPKWSHPCFFPSLGPSRFDSVRTSTFHHVNSKLSAMIICQWGKDAGLSGGIQPSLLSFVASWVTNDSDFDIGRVPAIIALRKGSCNPRDNVASQVVDIIRMAQMTDEYSARWDPFEPYHLDLYISPPADSLYSGAVFRATMILGGDVEEVYPFIRFDSWILHPDIDMETGLLRASAVFG